MAKLVVFSSGFPSAPPPSTWAEPTALTKMRTISHPQASAPGSVIFFQEKCLNTYQAPRAEGGWGAGPASRAPGSFGMKQKRSCCPQQGQKVSPHL